MFEEHVKQEGTVLFTEGLQNFGHKNFLLDAEHEDLVEEGKRLLLQLVEMVTNGVKRFSKEDKLSLQGLFTKLALEGEFLVLYEPLPNQNRKKAGDFSAFEQKAQTSKDLQSGLLWKRGIGNGLECLQNIYALLEEHELDMDLGDNIDLSEIFTASANLAKADQIFLQRKMPMKNHSGWEIVAREDQGNPACFSHIAQTNLWADRYEILHFLALPVGSKVLWKNNGQFSIEIPEQETLPTIAWNEPDEVWVHHHPAAGEHAEKIVSGQLLAKNNKAPEWEWLPAKEVSEHVVEICAIPFLLHGLALGDHVKINEHGIIQKKVFSSGNVAVRVQCLDKADALKSLPLHFVKKESLPIEWMNDQVFAVSFDEPQKVAEFMRQIEATEGMNLVSHSMPINHNPLSRSLFEMTLPGSLHAAAFVALIEGILLEGSRADKLLMVVFLFGINTLLLWMATTSRVWRPAKEIFHFKSHARRIALSIFFFMSAFWYLVMNVLFGSGLFIWNLVASIALGGFSAWMWRATPTNHDLPRKPEATARPISPYKYARALLQVSSPTPLKKMEVEEVRVGGSSVAGRLKVSDHFATSHQQSNFVEIFASGENVQAIFYADEDMSTTTFSSFEQALYTISKQKNLKASDWWIEI